MKRLAFVPVLLLAPLAARGSDAPHDLSTSPGISCTSCHIAHHATGGTITTTSGNANLCQSCHAARTGFGFPWTDADQAVPDVAGHSHRWDAPASSPAFGAAAPASPAMSQRLFGGTISCSTCHDQHKGASAFKGTQHVSVAPGAALSRIAGTGSGTLSLDTPAAAASPKGYLIEIVLGGAAGTATFHVSNDNGTSWFGWSAGTWTAGATAGAPTGTGVALDDGANVTVSFAGAFVAGDRWQSFYISYPFLRLANDASQICEDCHSARVQSSLYVESGGDGVKVFSHPVAETLAHAYDRGGGEGALLDANGTLQSAGDGIATNNLHLDAAGKVRCLTCHSPHNADSNSLTEDAR